MNETKLGAPFVGDHGYARVQVLTSDGAICSVVIEGGRQAIYRDGVRVGWVVTTASLDNKYGKRKTERSACKPKPNKGPIPRQQKWKQ